MEYGLNEGKVCHHEPLKSCDHVNIESQIKKGTSGALQALKPECSSGKYFLRVNQQWQQFLHMLTHADTGPFPVLGISVLCWSSSDSNFKMFNAA